MGNFIKRFEQVQINDAYTTVMEIHIFNDLGMYC